jgi:hypothetical protein
MINVQETRKGAPWNKERDGWQLAIVNNFCSCHWMWDDSKTEKIYCLPFCEFFTPLSPFFSALGNLKRRLRRQTQTTKLTPKIDSSEQRQCCCHDSPSGTFRNCNQLTAADRVEGSSCCGDDVRGDQLRRLLPAPTLLHHNGYSPVLISRERQRQQQQQQLQKQQQQLQKQQQQQLLPGWGFSKSSEKAPSEYHRPVNCFRMFSVWLLWNFVKEDGAKNLKKAEMSCPSLRKHD